MARLDGNVYVDPSYTSQEAIDAQGGTHSITGEALEFDANAFASGGTTSNVPAEGGTIFFNDLDRLASSIYNDGTYDMVLINTNSNYLYVVPKMSGKTYTRDMTVYIDGGTHQHIALLGRSGNVKLIGDLTFTAKNAYFGTENDNMGGGDSNFSDCLILGNITFDITDCTTGGSFYVHCGDVGSAEQKVKVTGTVTNFLSTSAFRGLRTGDGRTVYADFDLTVTGSSFSNNLELGYVESGATWEGTYTMNVSATTALNIYAFENAMELQGAHTFTLNVEAAETATLTNYVDYFDVVNVASGATLDVWSINNASELNIEFGGLVVAQGFNNVGVINVTGKPARNDTVVVSGLNVTEIGSRVFVNGEEYTWGKNTGSYEIADGNLIIHYDASATLQESLSSAGTITIEGEMWGNDDKGKFFFQGDKIYFAADSAWPPYNITVNGVAWDNLDEAFDLGFVPGYSSAEITEVTGLGNDSVTLTARDNKMELSYHNPGSGALPFRIALNCDEALELKVRQDTYMMINRDAIVTAELSGNPESYSLFFKLGADGAWTAYSSEGASVSENGTVFFKAVDSGANEIEFTGYEVTNIDRVAPTLQDISADITGPTNQPVTVTARFTDNDEVASVQYRIGQSGAWRVYQDGVTVQENTTVYFKAVDTVGNESVASYDVTNIDRTAPVFQDISVQIEDMQNQTVAISPRFADNEEIASTWYRIGENGEWTLYQDSVEVTGSHTVYFKAVDPAGNESAIADYTISENVFDVFLNSAYSDETTGTYCDGIRLQYGVNAFSTFADALAHVSENSSIVMTGGEIAEDITLNDARLVVKDGILKKINAGTGNSSLMIDGAVTVTDGIEGLASLSISTASVLTTDHITLDDGPVRLVESVDAEGVNYRKIIDTATGISGVSEFSSEGNRRYRLTHQDGDLFLLDKGRVYISLLYSEAVDGTTASNGDKLFWNINTFDYFSNQYLDETVEGSTVFLDGDFQYFFTGQPVNVYLSGVSCSGVVAGYNSDNPGQTRDGDFTFYSEGSTFTWYTAFAGYGTNEAHQNLIVANRVYDNPSDPNSGFHYEDTQWNLTFKGGAHDTNDFTVARYANICGGTVNITFEDYTLKGDLQLFRNAYNYNGECLKEINLTLNNVTAPAAKWCCVWDPREATDTKITITVTNSVFNGNDHTLGFIHSSTEGSWSGDGDFYISGFTMSGRISGARGTNAQSNNSNITGTRTLHVSGSNYSRIVRDFSVIEIAEDALLTADSIENVAVIKIAGQLQATSFNNVGKLQFLSGSVFYLNDYTIDSNTILSFDPGAIIGLDISGKTPASGNPIDSSIVLSDNINYTIIVSDFQNCGEYEVAKVALESIGTITLSTKSGESLGVLIPGGEVLQVGERSYSLRELDGSVFLSVDGVISGKTLVNETITVLSGTVFRDTAIGSGGRLSVMRGGIADNTMVSSGGSLSVMGGGIADNTMVSSGGSLSVLRGGIASGVSTAMSGYVTVSSGGRVEDALFAGGIGQEMVTIEHGGVLSSAQVTDGVDVSVYGGSAYDIVLIQENGESGDASDLYLYEGSYAENVTVYQGGWFDVYDNARVNGATINSGAHFGYDQNAILENITINGDYDWYVYSNCSVNGLTVNPGARVFIQPGATVTNIIENGGMVDVQDGATATFLPNTISGMVLGSNQSASLHSGTTATSTIVSSGGGLGVFNGGVANGVVVSRGGFIGINQGASVSGLKVMNSGTLEMTLDSRTNVSGTFGGSAFAAENGVIDGYELNNLKSLNVLDGGTARNTVVSSGGRFTVGSGGFADGTTVESNGDMTVYSGGRASNTAISGGIEISSGGTAAGVSLSGNGQMTIQGGATVTGLAAESGARMYLTVDDETYVTGTANGSAFEIKDGKMDGFTTTHGNLSIQSGCVATDLTLSGDNYLYVNGGTVKNLALDRGNYWWNWNRININGGVLTGQISIDGIDVRFSNDGILLFDITELTPDMDVTLLDSYSNIKDSPLLIATVSDAQMQGSYVLARNANSFNSYITVNTEDGTFLEELNLVDNTLEYAGRMFTLRLTGDVLTMDVVETDCPVITLTGDNTTPLRSSTLTASSDPGVDIYFSTDYKNWSLYTGEIAINENATYYFKGADGDGFIGTNWITFGNIDTIPPEAPTASASITVDTIGKVTVTAVFSEDTAVKEYSFDGKNWQPYESGVVFSENGTVFFRGADEVGNVSEVTSYEVTNILTGDLYKSLYVDEAFGSVGEGIAEGATHSVTGAPLVWGVNAFSSLDAALDAMLPGQNVYISNIVGENLDTRDQVVNLHISGSTIPVLINGYTTGDQVYFGDVLLTVDNSQIATASGSYLFGFSSVSAAWEHPLLIIGNLTLEVKDSTIGGDVGGIRVKGMDFVHVLGTEEVPATITLDFRDSIIRDDFVFIGDSPIGKQETFQGVDYVGANLVINLDNVLVPENKWWSIHDGDNKSEGTITVNIRNSTIGRSTDGVMRFGLDNNWGTSWGSTPVNYTNYVFNVENTDFAGYLLAGRLNCDELGDTFTGAKTLNLFGDNNIRYTYWFKELNLAPGATLTGCTLRMASAGGKINVDVTGYTGASKILVAMEEAFENVSAEDITVTGIDSSVYQILSTDRLIVLKGNDTFKDLYVNSSYTSMDAVLGTSYNGEALFYGDNAFASVSDAIPHLTDGAVLHVTGGEHSLNSGALFNNSILINDYARLTMKSEGAAPITIDGDLVNNGTVVISAAGFIEDPQLDRIVLTADSISGNGYFETDNNGYTVQLVGNEVHLLQNTHDVAVCADWGSAYAPGDYIPGWYYTGDYYYGTFGVDGFATLGEAERAVSILGTITVINSDVSFTNAVVNNVYATGEYTVIRNAHVTAGKSLTVSNLAKVSASSLVIDEGASVSFNNHNSIFEFDVTAQAPGMESTLNLSRINGIPIFRLYLASDQQVGEYVLGTNAAGLDSSIIVEMYVDGQIVNGINSLTEKDIFHPYGDRLYGLSIDDDDQLVLKCAKDTAIPVLVSIQADITDPTNQPVTVSAEFTDDFMVNNVFYRIGDGGWEYYAGNGVTVYDNTIVSFKAEDFFGNESEIASYAVTNIDIVPPTRPEISVDVTQPTPGNVVVAAVFSEDSVRKEYSLDGWSWQDYTQSIEFEQNGTVWFRAWDAVGNVSEVASWSVTNIDKVAPNSPTASADITKPTNTDVLVSAEFSEDSVKREFSRNGQTWEDYLGSVSVSENGVVYFRGMDEAGNYSQITSYFVSNIDKTPPEKPVAIPSTTKSTNQDVTVTATFSDDSAVKESSLDGENWTAYYGAVRFPENGVVYFRAKDAVGNVSEVTVCEVTNIDKVAPNSPLVSADINTLTNQPVTVTAVFDDDVTYMEYSTDGLVWTEFGGSIQVEENVKLYFRGRDAAGNVSGIAAYDVTNIDRTPLEKPQVSADITKPTNGKVKVTAVFTADAVVREYSFDGQTWQAYTTAVEFSDNGTVYFRGTNKAGTTSDVTPYEVTNIDKVAPEKPVASADITAPTNTDVLVTATFSTDTVVREYSIDGQTWSVYTDGVRLEDNGAVYFRGTDEAGNTSEVTDFLVSNIDKVAPVAPVASADNSNVTNGNVTVTAAFSDDSIKKEYSLDGENWTDYTEAGVTLTENGTVFFRGTDAAGNISDATMYDVTNIDRVTPVIELAGDSTTPLPASTLSASTEEDIEIFFSTDNETWTKYEEQIAVTANATYYFMATDLAGNTGRASITFNNIDATAPVISAATLSQGEDGYVFTAEVAATDDRTAPADLKYYVRYADSAESVTEAEAGSGLAFTLNSSDAGKMLYYQAGVADNAGNITWTEAKAFTVSDHTAPVLNGLPQAEFKNRMVFVSWDPASDNIGVAGYRLTLNNETYELQEPGFVLEGAGPGSYTYQVTAYDEAGYEAKSEVGTLTVENRADLYIASVRILKNGVNTTTISTKDEVELSIQIGNMGDVDAAKTVAAIYCGELLLTDISVSEISVGGLRECTYTIAAGRMSTGIQDIRVEVNSQKSIAEYDESNNVRSLTLNVENTSLSDLVIGSIGLDKSVYSAEDNAVLTFTVRNIGYSKASSASKVYIYDGDAFLGSMDVEALEAATGTDAMNYTIEAGRLTPGNHTIRIVADGEKIVSETNEENNGAQIQLTVGLCDLSISKLSLSQEVCDTEEAVTLNFTVRNGGTDKAAASFAGIYDGDTLLGTVEIGELSRGLSVSKQFVIAAGSLSVGEHNLRVVADATKLVSESDEDNNSRGAVLSVFQKDDDAPEFAEVMIRQGDNDYVFEVSAVAFDNITFDEDIVYGVRFAETKAGLEEAEILEGTEFSLTPEYAGKTMYYQVSATDLAGNTRWCVARPFTVKDRTAPEIGNIMVSTTGSVLRLNWEASDNIAVTSYKVYCDGKLVATQEAASFTQDSVSVGSHMYRIEALDAAGNVSTTGNIKVNFDDMIAPEIESVSAEQSADGYDITFAVTATDNETQSSDIVHRVQYAFAAEDVANAPLSGLNLALAPEDAGRTLYYRVSAVDEAGNTVWTDIHSLAIADKTAPKAPTDLSGSVNGAGVTLNWTASSDNVGVAGYQVRYGATESLGGDGVLVEGNQYELTALKEGVYYWQTAAVDAAGNVSEWSEVKSFRILPEDMFGANDTAEHAYDLGALSGEHTLAGGAISSATDEGWFKFTLDAKGTANDFIQIAFDNREGDLDLYLYSANGTTLLQASDGTTGDTERISLKDLQKGTYLLKVVGKNGAMNTFNISTKKVAGYDMDVYDANGRNDSLEAATVFDIEKTPQATVSGLNLHEAGDVDFYQLTLTNMGLEGDGVSISFENSVGDLDLVLFDSKGMKIAESAGTANVESVSFNGLAAGSYYVQVVAAHNAVNEYTLNWNFASNKVEADALEGQEPYAITESTELTNLSISAGDGVTQEDTFTLTLNQPGSATSKIRFSNYRSDWNGLKYVVKDSTDAVVLSGIGSEISLDDLEAGDYSLTVDTPVAGSFSSYDISVSLPDSAGTKWTYMVYMAADSNLDTYALYDLIAMQQANLDSQIDIYVMVDRSETSAYELTSLAARNKWDSAWSDTRVGKITYNPGSTVSVDWESWGELDTSSIATLKQFVEWAQDQSRAENYGLIMWDHGMEDGSLCVDGTTDADWGTSLSISEVSAFLAEKGNIPLVIFNNCLLGSELVATQMTGSTDVIVVSEAESHPQNSTYAYKDFFSTITADMTAEEMAKVLVQNVRQYGDGSQPSMLSAVDVADSRLATALEELAEAVSAGNNNDKTALINGMLKTLQDGCAYAGSTVYQSDLYDMIVQTMGDRRYANASNGFKAALADLKSALEDVVLVSRSVPENRGYGIAAFNPVLTVKTYAAAGYSTKKVSEVIQSYLDANYAANPAWADLLSDLAKTYQTQYSSSIKSASFSVSSIVDIGKDELISSMDLGCFSGQGEVIDGISLLGDLYLGVTITSGATSTGGFAVANDMNIDVTVTILASDGSFVASGANSVNFSGLAVGDYYILLQGDDDCTVTLSFEANWTTGVDRFDYAQSKVNEKFANGNGSIAKASALAAGYYSGLLTYQGDTDWYQIGNVYTEKYKVVLEGAAGMTVAEYDAEGKLVQTAKYANGKYTMTVKSMNYLFVEGSADLNLDQVNAYSVDISGVQAGAEEEEDIIPPTAPVASADVTTATNGNVIVSAVFSDDSAVKEYSLDGVNWQAYPEGGVIIIINGTVFFRAFDEAGNVSEVTDFLVSNIDKTAPTAPSGLQAVVADQTVTLSWASSTDDLAGVKEYVVKYSHDGQEFTLTTAETSLVLENVDFATWQWNVTAFDAVGNASEVTAGEAFTVEEAVGPETRTFNLFTGRFAGGSQAMLANEDKGIVTIYANGTVWGTELVLDPGWKIAGVGDFDANGQDDFLRVNSEGYVVGEKTQTNGMFEVQVLNFRNAGWSILGTGDFNGNGSDDVLIANPTAASDTVGLLGYWESGVTWTLINGYSAEWEMIATGDYNADGKCDMLWRNSFVGDGGLTYNAFCTWIVEPPAGQSDWRMVSVANPAEWNFLCAGDFNGDDANDIAMINDVGVVGIWGVEDGWLSSWSILSAVNTSEWTLAGVGDFNADGTDDIAWVNNASGMAGYWQIEDKTLASWQNIATIS